MSSSIRKHLIFGLAAIPVGAVSGYVCAFIVDFAAVFFESVYYSHPPYDFALDFRYVTICWAPVGARLGAVILPIAYLVLLRHITVQQVPRIIGWLYCGVLGFGLAASVLGEFMAFFAVFSGFLAGLIYGYSKTKVQTAA